MSRSPARPWLRPLLAFAAGLVLAVGAGLALLGGDRSASAPSVPRPLEAGASSPGAAPTATAADSVAGGPAGPEAPEPAPAGASASQTQPLAPFATLELSRASFPTSGLVAVRLDLVEPSADDEPRPVRMFSVTDQRGIIADARLDESRSVATLELDPNFLQPGEYLVEVKTTERSAFPVRRYSIVVR